MNKISDNLILKDMFFSERYISECYCRYAGASSSKNIKEKLLALLNDSQALSDNIKDEMIKRNYIAFTEASLSSINQTLKTTKESYELLE